jgi:hypothetical protein
MQVKRRTAVNVESIAKQLIRAVGEAEVEGIARECGLLRRKRTITPMALLVACLSTLAVANARWLADILRTFNQFTGKAVRYKPFHNQLAKDEFPRFLHQVVQRALANLALPILASLPKDKLAMFRDILLHDGTSFALKDALKEKWPGRFTKVTPAAVELHVTMSALSDQPIGITLAPDKEAERQFGPSATDITGCLLLEDRGYEHRQYFIDVQAAGGYYIVRGNAAIRPTIRKAYDRSGRRVRYLEGKRLQWKILLQEDVDLDIEWGKGKSLYRGRLVALYKRGKRNKKTFMYLHTNLDRKVFRIADVATLYRLRWQIELLFKEWKSHANLHKFDTRKSPIAEGLIWASILAATLQRFIAHAAERISGIELSTQRVAACARHFFDEILRALQRGARTLRRCLAETLGFLGDNARRAHPKRDRKRGRLATGLRPVSTSGAAGARRRAGGAC